MQDIELPEPVDLIVHEILGEIASREGTAAVQKDGVFVYFPIICVHSTHVFAVWGVVASLRDAERFLSATAKQGKRWSVPSRARTFLAPAEMPKPTSGFLLEGIPTKNTDL